MRCSLLATVLLGGCLKQTPPVQAPTAWTVDLVTVLESAERGTVEGSPVSFTDALEGELREHGLTPRVVDPSAWTAVFETKRTTEQRVAHLRLDTDAHLLVLVEAEARWFSQMAGRYRWTVDVDVTLGELGATVGGTHERFQVPVALLFDHQREPEAIVEATTVIERRVGEVVDTWLRGLGEE
jgi:hypothetical protein